MIFVDERVGSSDRKSRSERLDEFLTLIRSHRIDAESSRYDSGDFYFEGNGPGDRTIDVGIERKSIRDLIGSMRSNKLSDKQIPAMLETFHISWVIVEGLFRPCPNSGLLQEYRGSGAGWVDLTIGRQTFMHSEIERFLMQLTMTVGLQYPGRPLFIWTTRNVKETVNAIANLYAQLARKKWDQHRSFTGITVPVVSEPMVFHKRTREEENTLFRRRVAMCNTGIGNDTGKAIATHFRSGWDYVHATEGELREVDGVGKTRAASIVKEWRNAD